LGCPENHIQDPVDILVDLQRFRIFLNAGLEQHPVLDFHVEGCAGIH
jgi:hypothetical protein